MANKREIKKALEAATGQFCDEMMLEAAFCKDDAKVEKISQLVTKLLGAYEVARKQCSVLYDKTPKAFDSLKEYHKARRDFYRKMYERIAADYNKTLNEVAVSFKELLG